MHLRKGIGAVILAGAVAVSAAPTAYCNDTGTEPIERPGWTLVFQEEFNDAVLNPAKFSDSYMPHWTTPEQSLAHYDVVDGILSLRIDKETQGPWWAFDDVQKISSIQTGMRDGMHNFWDTCTITDHHRAVTNFETKYGYFDEGRVPHDGGLHSAWWDDRNPRSSERMKRLKLMFLRFAGRMSKLVKAVFAFPCIHGQTAAARNKAWITTLRAMYHRISMCMDLNGSQVG